MTPEDAKKRWCPHVRTGLTSGVAVNHSVSMEPDGRGPFNLHNETRCMGPDCMMWQWHQEFVRGETGMPQWPRLSTIEGYCGIAGDSQ